MAFIDCLNLPCEVIIHFVDQSLFIILKINFHLSDFLFSHSLDFVSFLIKKGLHVLNLFFIGFNDLLSLVFELNFTNQKLVSKLVFEFSILAYELFFEAEAERLSFEGLLLDGKFEIFVLLVEFFDYL